MQRALAIALLAFALAGCADAPPTDVGPDEPTAVVAGHVFDPAMRPIADATVILGGSLVNRTDEEGRFEFVVPGAQTAYALRVNAAGFLDQTRVLQSNDPSPSFDEQIVLEPVPAVVAYKETYTYTGTIACSFFAQAQHSHGGPGDPGSHNSNDCSQGTNDDVYQFRLDPGVRNVVIEMFWTPNSPVSDRLAIFVQGPGLDNGDDVLFYFNEGPTGIRAHIGLLQSTTYYQETGGDVRITVKIGAPEEDVAAGVAVNQQFDIFATAFYVLPGDSNYSVLDE